MAIQILLIDPFEQHRKVVKRFLNQTHPDTSIIEIDPTEFLLSGDSFEWTDYDLLIIDNRMGNQDGIEWVSLYKDDDGFPPFLFLSSEPAPDSDITKNLIDNGMSLGAEGFLFKKHLNADLLEQHVSSALDKQSPQDEDDENGAEDISEKLPDDLEEVSESAMLALQDTFHQMEHAKALLHGHDDWPFSVKDLMDGKAVFGNYIVKYYMGRRDDVYTFAGHKSDGTELFALKLIDKSITKGQPPSEKFKKDVEALIGMTHPNIVRWLDFQAIEGHILMVQEMIHGDRLSKKLKRSVFSEEEAIRFILQILSGLTQLHDAGISAGAMSPENLLFKDEDTLVLTHFNNIYFSDRHDTAGVNQVNYQDALYLSPESLTGHHTDHRSDLYVVGAILYHMLSGKPPFDGPTTQSVIDAHKSSPTPSLRDANHPMNPVIQSLMNKTPSKRYHTATEVSKDIKRIYKL
ncbi:MAG: response regulator [Gammaproteobacteria bacterium]|nr:MAG: response regulator [Gammaproteobacteria bacterium]